MDVNRRGAVVRGAIPSGYPPFERGTSFGRALLSSTVQSLSVFVCKKKRADATATV
jgi:hypothetical protein